MFANLCPNFNMSYERNGIQAYFGGKDVRARIKLKWHNMLLSYIFAIYLSFLTCQNYLRPAFNVLHLSLYLTFLLCLVLFQARSTLPFVCLWELRAKLHFY